MVLNLAAQKATWLQLLLTKLRLLIYSNQFSKIYICEYNKYIEAILLLDSIFHPASISNQIQPLLIG